MMSSDLYCYESQSVSFELADESAMYRLGNRLAQCFRAGLLITLRGELGMGKTTLARGILRGLGHTGSVKSPTYAVLEPYDMAFGRVYHFDFYRLADPEELEFLGFRDYLLDAHLCLVEWPEQGEGYLGSADVDVGITQFRQGRRLTFKGLSDAGVEVLARLTLPPGNDLNNQKSIEYQGS